MTTAPIGAQFPDLPDASASLRAFETVDGWIRRWDVPTDAMRIDPEATAGASVTIRYRGSILGRASVMSEGGDALWRAARSALLEASGQLAFAEGDGRDGAIAAAAAQMCVECEIAGSLTPLLGESYESAANLAPGIHGLAARVSDRIEAVFPGAARSTNSLPAHALRAAVGKLKLAPLELGELRQRHELVVYRFPVRHMAKPGIDQAARFLYRGNRIIPLSEVTTERVRNSARLMAVHLINRRWQGSEPNGLLGDYLVHADRYEPMVASPVAQSLTALALGRFAMLKSLPAPEADEALDFARSLLLQLTVVTPSEEDPLASPEAAALWIIARSEIERASAQPIEAPRTFELAARARVGTVFSLEDGWSADSRRGVRALICFALVRSAFDDDPDGTTRALAIEATRSLLRDTDLGNWPTLMPWAGWAQRELSDSGAWQGPDALLREFRDLIWTHQVDEFDIDDSSQDLIGGLVFTRAGPELPTWLGLRPAAWAASTIGDPQVTSQEERPGQVAAMRRLLRFLLQLTVTDDDCPYVPDCGRARGGVRAATWDQRQPVEATALGLIVASETLAALDGDQ